MGIEEKYLESRMDRLEFYRKLNKHLSAKFPNDFNEEEFNWIKSQIKKEEGGFYGGYYIHFKPKDDIDFSDKKVFRKFKKSLEDNSVKIQNAKSGWQESNMRINLHWEKYDNEGNIVRNYVTGEKKGEWHNPDLKIVSTPLERKGYNKFVLDNGHPKEATPTNDFYYQGKEIKMHNGFRNYTDTGFSLWFKTDKETRQDEVSFLIFQSNWISGVNITDHVSKNWLCHSFRSSYIQEILLKYFDATALWVKDDYKNFNSDVKNHKLDVDLSQISV